MHYLFLVLTVLMWSFVGVMVKTASGMVGSSVITLCRFLFGVVFLVVLLLIKDGKIRFQWKHAWIWLGVLGKSANYIFENIALSMGVSYGNIIVMPVQAVFVAFVAIVYFKEELNWKKLASVILCITGVLLVSWKGVPLTEFFTDSLLTTVLFLLAAIGAGTHIISQKKLIEHMDSGNMNFSVFLLSTVLMAVPMPFVPRLTGTVSLWAVLSLVVLGFITGISFYLYAEALKKISLLAASVIGNSAVLFSLLWSWLLFDEVMNLYVGMGAIALVAGLVLLSIPKRTVVSINSAKSA